MQDQWMRDGKGFLLVYNITSRPTFDEVSTLYDKILRTKDSEHVPMSAGSTVEAASEGKREEVGRTHCTVLTLDVLFSWCLPCAMLICRPLSPVCSWATSAIWRASARSTPVRARSWPRSGGASSSRRPRVLKSTTKRASSRYDTHTHHPSRHKFQHAVHTCMTSGLPTAQSGSSFLMSHGSYQHAPPLQALLPESPDRATLPAASCGCSALPCACSALLLRVSLSPGLLSRICSLLSVRACISSCARSASRRRSRAPRTTRARPRRSPNASSSKASAQQAARSCPAHVHSLPHFLPPLRSILCHTGHLARPASPSVFLVFAPVSPHCLHQFVTIFSLVGFTCT